MQNLPFIQLLSQALSSFLDRTAPRQTKQRCFLAMRQRFDLTLLGGLVAAGRLSPRAVELYAAMFAVALAKRGGNNPHVEGPIRVSVPAWSLADLVCCCERTIDRLRRQLIEAGVVAVVDHGARNVDCYELRVPLKYLRPAPIDGTEGSFLRSRLGKWYRRRLGPSAPLLSEVEARVLSYLYCGGFEQYGYVVQRSGREIAEYLSITQAQFWRAVRTLEQYGCLERRRYGTANYRPKPFRRLRANQYRVAEFSVGVVDALRAEVARIEARDAVAPEFPGVDPETGELFPRGWQSYFTRIMQQPKWQEVEARFSWKKWLTICATAGVL